MRGWGGEGHPINVCKMYLKEARTTGEGIVCKRKGGWAKVEKMWQTQEHLEKCLPRAEAQR